jgi:hypothetical protein
LHKISARDNPSLSQREREREREREKETPITITQTDLLLKGSLQHIVEKDFTVP